ncbi:MAG TPA: NTPase [Anaerolineae bacterium]|nr:NTPase [Anaerolineae bacterium]
MRRTLLLTGRPGVGKTTIIKHLAQALGDRAGGFYTEEILGPGGRKGFRVIALDGQQATLAHVDIRSRSKVGRYGVDVAGFERVGVAALRRAIESAEIVIFDEIGKMELFSSQFKSAVIKAIDCGKPVIATAMIAAEPWVDALKRMPGVRTIEVTKQNRGTMAVRVLQWLEDRLKSDLAGLGDPADA